MEIAYCKALAKAKVVYIHHKTLGNLAVKSFHFKFAE